MKKIKYIIIIICHSISLTGWSQFIVYNKGISITNASSDIHIKGSYLNESNGNIANGGRIYISEDLINNSNNAVFATKAGKVIFNGIVQQNIAGTSTINFFNLDINKPLGNILLGQNAIINDTLKLSRGSLNLNSKNIDLLGTGYLANENNANRIFGNSGLIKALRLFQHPGLSENIAGLGLYISSKDNFDTTYFERGHRIQTFSGDSSIYRYYNFTPTNPGNIDTLKFSYLDNSETIPNEYLYKIFSSDNDGLLWKNKGGLIDTINNFVLTTTVSPPDLGKTRLSVFPTENFATCLPNDPNYISAIFLVSTQATNEDSVKFVQLSTPNPQSFTWNFGDTRTATEESPFHVYHLSIDTIASSYPVTMTVTNGICSDTRKKTIQINPATNALRNMATFKGISFIQLFPNPNEGICNLEVSTFEVVDLLIDIIDSEGNSIHKIIRRTDNFNEPLNFDQFASGLYFLKVQAGNDQRVVKLVKI
jgi:hypothetical protein